MANEAEKALEAIEIARTSGKIKKGTNEVTKALERGTARLVAVAKDISPPEIAMHLPILAKEKGIPCIQIDSKEELGAAAGIKVPTSAIAIIAEGDAKKLIKELSAKPAEEKKEKPKAEPAEEKKEKPKKEAKPKEEKAEKKEEVKEEAKAEPAEEKKEEPKAEEKPAEEKKE